MDMWCRTSKRWIIVISPVWRRWTRLFFAPWILFYGPHKRNVLRYNCGRGALHFGIHKFQPRSNKTDNNQQISMARASVYPCDCRCVGITKICFMTKKKCANDSSCAHDIGGKCDRHMIGKSVFIWFGGFCGALLLRFQSPQRRCTVHNKNNGHGNHRRYI